MNECATFVYCKNETEEQQRHTCLHVFLNVSVYSLSSITERASIIIYFRTSQYRQLLSKFDHFLSP